MRITAILIAVCALTAGGCAVNPVTGESDLNLMPMSWDLEVGSQQYDPARQSQGGDYVADPQVEAYVNSIGQRLAQHSDLPLPYEFNVINNSVPNAWALPGGKITINRGLLTTLENEAELAAVLGHEIVHAAARHGAQSVSRGTLLQGAVIGVAIASQDSRYANVAPLGASIAAQLITTRYGRDAERESDFYGMQYMQAAGYDPTGAVTLQEKFVQLSEGRNPDFLSGLFASHPPSQERVENNRARAAELGSGGELGTERYRMAMAHLVETRPAYEAYDRAQEAFVAGNTAAARTLISRALSIEPDEGHFHSFLGDLEQSDRNYTAALARYENAIRRNPEFFYYYLQRGLVNRQLRNRDDAKVDLRRSLELLPTSNAMSALGDIARDEGNLAEAREYYAAAAGEDSSAGRAALSALVEIDLPENPGQWITTQHQVNPAGGIGVQITNTTPHNVGGLVIGVQYRVADGSIRQASQSLGVILQPGQSTVTTLPVTVEAGLAQFVRTGVVAARIIR